MKMIVTAAILALLVGCTPATPEEQASKEKRMSQHYNRYIKDNSYDVCVRGVKHIYFSNGNASQVVLLLDEDSKVIPCKEATQ